MKLDWLIESAVTRFKHYDFNLITARPTFIQWVSQNKNDSNQKPTEGYMHFLGSLVDVRTESDRKWPEMKRICGFSRELPGYGKFYIFHAYN